MQRRAACNSLASAQRRARAKAFIPWQARGAARCRKYQTMQTSLDNMLLGWRDCGEAPGTRPQTAPAQASPPYCCFGVLPHKSALLTRVPSLCRTFFFLILPSPSKDAGAEWVVCIMRQQVRKWCPHDEANAGDGCVSSAVCRAGRLRGCACRKHLLGRAAVRPAPHDMTCSRGLFRSCIYACMQNTLVEVELEG